MSSSPPATPRPPLLARLLEWRRRHRLELELARGIALAITALLAIIWPTPRMIAAVCGGALAVVLDVYLELRKLRRLLPLSMTIRDCRTGIQITKGAETSDTEIAADLNGAMRQAIDDLEQPGGDDGDR